MRGLILAGGSGTRLRPITHTSAKQLVPIANKPVLFYVIEAMADAGITQVGIIIGETGPEVREAVGDGSRFGVEVTYIPQEQPLGLAHAVLIARDFLGEDDFVMYLGDNLLEEPLSELVERFREARSQALEPTFDGPAVIPAVQILLCPVPDPHRFGVAELDAAGNVARLVEKPEHPTSDLALAGVYVFTPAVHEAVRAIHPSARGELEITDAIQWLIDHGHAVRQELVRGWWLDTGKKDSLLESNRRVLESVEPKVAGTVDADSVVDGRVRIEAGAEVVRSHVRGPAVIGEGARVVDSFIGPFTAIAPECRIVDSEVENSVILERASISGVPRMVDSLVGRDTDVRRSGQRPRATRLMIGDHCSVDIA